MSKPAAVLKDAVESREQFAKRFRSCMPARGGIKELAGKIGCTHQAVRRWLNAETEPSRDYLVAIARELNVSLSWLASGKGDRIEGAPVVGVVDAQMAFDSFEGVLEFMVSEGVDLPIDVSVVRKFAEALAKKISEDPNNQDPELTQQEVERYADFMRAAMK